MIEYAQVLLGGLGGVFMGFSVLQVLRAFRRGRHELPRGNHSTRD